VLWLAGAGVAVVGWFRPGSPHDHAGLQNRRAFDEALSEALDEGRRLALLLVDVNDSRRAYARR
jgi:hypothetical protein